MKFIRRITISLGITFVVGSLGTLLFLSLPVTGWKALTVPTGSMRPTIPPGSLVLMHRVPIQSLKVGDVITYINMAKPGSTITHRIIKSYKLDNKVPAFLTKGDANPSPDSPITGGLVLGKTVWHLPYLGGWVSYIKKPYILLPIVYIPALAIMFEEIKRLYIFYKKQQPYLLRGFERPVKPKGIASKLATSMKLSVVILIFLGLVASPASALLRSNSVAIINNKISVAKVVPPNCPSNNSISINLSGPGNSNNNVNINSSSDQNSSSGNVSSDSDPATSGNASNVNCTNITVTIYNH